MTTDHTLTMTVYILPPDDDNPQGSLTDAHRRQTAQFDLDLITVVPGWQDAAVTVRGTEDNLRRYLDAVGMTPEYGFTDWPPTSKGA